jgi:hypothetical protein
MQDRTMEVRMYFSSGNRITIEIQEKEWVVLRHEMTEIPEIIEVEIREAGRYIWSVLDRDELEVAR